LNEQELWKRQTWDTQASYEAFTEYYLVQDTPRTFQQAYRLFKAAKGGQPGGNAPGFWRYWYEGKNKQGEPIPGAVSWDKRAQAWDDYNKQLAFEQETKLRLAKRKQRRAMLDRGFYNITKMLDKLDPEQFSPKNLDTPELIKAASALTNSLRIISDQLRAEYDDTPAQNINLAGSLTTKHAPVVKVYIPDNGRNDRGN
jgi:hypothetical protein